MTFDCGRNGCLNGVFVADTEDVETLIKHKIQVYFGEVLGKHSEVYGSVEEKEMEKMTDNQEFIGMFEQLNLSTGENPFIYPVVSRSIPDFIDYHDDMTVYEAVKEIQKKENEPK